MCQKLPPEREKPHLLTIGSLVIFTFPMKIIVYNLLLSMPDGNKAFIAPFLPCGGQKNCLDYITLPASALPSQRQPCGVV